jgi:hypothetical protein
MTVQALAQQYQHPLSSCIAQPHHQQQPVSCSRHSRSSVIRCSAAGAASTGVEAASAAAQQQQQQQQQSSSNGSSHQVIDMDALEDSDADSSSSSSSRPDVVIEVLTSADELQAVARLRAEAYYAVSCFARFTRSYIIMSISRSICFGSSSCLLLLPEYSKSEYSVKHAAFDPYIGIMSSTFLAC